MGFLSYSSSSLSALRPHPVLDVEVGACHEPGRMDACPEFNRREAQLLVRESEVRRHHMVDFVDDGFGRV